MYASHTSAIFLPRNLNHSLSKHPTYGSNRCDLLKRESQLPPKKRFSIPEPDSSAIHARKTKPRTELLLTRVAVISTLFATCMLIGFFVVRGHEAFSMGHFWIASQAAALGICTLFLIYGSLVYQCCRLSYLQRKQDHLPASRDLLDSLYADDHPSLTLLIPSYKEEPNVVWQTLMSAALTEFPEKQVVLLIDDPPNARSDKDQANLEAMRSMPLDLDRSFSVAAARYQKELSHFQERGCFNPESELRHLGILYGEAAQYLKAMAAEFVSERAATPLSHTDAFFLKAVLKTPAQNYSKTIEDLEQQVASNKSPSRETIERHYRRLAGLFNVRFGSFERKKYTNISQEPNKAMNLNAYIGLMGKGWHEVQDNGRWELRESSTEAADFSIPDADYIITLDADSLLLSDYALRLVYEMEQKQGARIAVIQTPYSAIPCSPIALERLAGATTDLQYIIHQGLTAWNATFWVGANALLRKKALGDIKQLRVENGHEVPVYIQDRTPIEDTESSIDLINKGWRLHNYPKRLAYSATPPDFGALLIQRRRWSNGGLLIVPKLLGYCGRALKSPALLKEFFMRFHYLASPAGASAVMLLIFLFPFDDSLATVWIPLSAVPYFVLYARDLRTAGYRYSDVVRVYALNLALLPVVIGGVVKSLQQAASGVKFPFGRTPKTTSRVTTPALYAGVEIGLPLFFLAAFSQDMLKAHWSHAACSLLNGVLLTYAVVRLFGLRNLTADFKLGCNNILARMQQYVRPSTKAAAQKSRGHIGDVGYALGNLETSTVSIIVPQSLSELP